MIERIEGMPAGTIGLLSSGTGLRVWVRDHAAWKRFALVTDVEWVAKAMRLFTWMTPGEVLVLEDLDKLDEARAWVAEGLP